MTVLLVAGVAVALALKRGRQKVALLQFKQATLGAPKQQSINMKHMNASKAAAAVGSSSLYGRAGGGGRAAGGHVGHESEDSDNSSVYHEPYKRLPSIKNHDYAPTTFLFKKKDVSSSAVLTTSKSSEYTGEWASRGRDDRPLRPRHVSVPFVFIRPALVRRVWACLSTLRRSPPRLRVTGKKDSRNASPFPNARDRTV